MIIWIDAQLSPALASWIRTTFGIDAVAVHDLQLRDATDHEIFRAARAAGAIVKSKDSDFVQLLDRFGPPPHVIWPTWGNTSNVRLQEILAATLEETLSLLQAGEKLVEIGDS